MITANLGLVGKAVKGNELAETRMRNALIGAERAARLTRQLLAFARRQPLEPKVVIDVLFADIGLPDMKGTELAAELRRRQPELRIILATGYVEPAASSVSAGAIHLGKPYQPAEVEKAFARLNQDDLGSNRSEG